jgi:hypothetical protein
MESHNHPGDGLGFRGEREEKGESGSANVRVEGADRAGSDFAKLRRADGRHHRKPEGAIERREGSYQMGAVPVGTGCGQADLVVGVRKGTGKVANPTISGGPVDSRPGTIETTDNQRRIGVQQGHPPDVADPAGSAGPNDRVHPGVAVGQPEDTFQVFQGGLQCLLDNPPVWKLIAKDGLKPPEVAAVQQFRKAVEESEKAAQQKQQAQQQANQQGQKSNP